MWKQFLIFVLIIGVVNLSDVTYYEILGISKQASTQEIRQAYKKLAVKLHPDKNPNEQEKFLKITEAYETLKDPEKKHKYDVYGSYSSYSRKYDYKSQSEYDNLYHNGLYHDDQFVETLSGASFYNYLNDGFYFINFYSPFCPPCQNVADHWKKLAEMYKGVVNVGAVNCKYHNSFCYNSMRISSYPSLLFYPNGKNGNYVYYQGDRTLEALDQFLMTYIRSHVHLPTLAQIRGTEHPIAYVLGVNRIGTDVLTRIAYKLKNLVTIAIIEDDALRAKLTTDDYTTVVFKYNSVSKEISSTEENQVLKEIVDALPLIEKVDPEKLKEIRQKLRSGSKKTWVLYFSTKGDDKLELHQMKIAFPNMNFGEVDCDKWGELCASLHIESPPGWGVLKRGGAYQAGGGAARRFIQTAATTTNLHTLSTSDLQKILDGDLGLWVVLVAPFGQSWAQLAEPFTQASEHFLTEDTVHFGVLACTAHTDAHCRRVAHEPTIVAQMSGARRAYTGRGERHDIVRFVQMVRDSQDIQLTSEQMVDIQAPSRSHTWLVAFLPARCGPPCLHVSHQWMEVASKLKPLESVRVGVLDCARTDSLLCANVRSPAARLYPAAQEHYHSVNLQNMAQAPYILEWALERIDDSVTKLEWNSFSKNVLAEELNPTRVKPWLVYFHSPRCFRCYEMYSEFAIAGILLNNAVHLGKVNCLTSRGLCQQQHISSYPALRLHLNRNRRHGLSSVVTVQVRDHRSIMQDIERHLLQYDESLLAGFKRGDSFHIRHDEF